MTATRNAVAQAPTGGKPVVDVNETGCCIGGGGPAGAVLALLLARKGVAVTLLESHHDFDRDFRGDTIHPSTLEVMDQIGLADRLLERPHAKLRAAQVQAGTTTAGIDLSHLPTRFPFIAMMPQVLFLEFIVEEARKHPSFRLVMGARVDELLTEDGEVKGVRYQAEDGAHEVRAKLVVGADGRFSKVRMLAGIEPVKSSAPMDVLWFRLPRGQSDPHGVQGNARDGKVMIMLERPQDWQCGFIIPKGGYQKLKADGLDVFKQRLVDLVPWLSDRVNVLDNWKHISLLSVESSRCRRWYKPGLLLIGDAAHVMSPVGGVGINYAIMDAVEAYNVLKGPLASGTVTEADLARVQKKREWPTRVIQTFQSFAQKRVFAQGLTPGQTFRPPFFMRIGPLRKMVARFIAFGISPARVEE